MKLRFLATFKPFLWVSDEETKTVVFYFGFFVIIAAQ